MLDWLISLALFQLTSYSEPSSHLHNTMGAVLQHNLHYFVFVWREPANCITLISQAVFIQVITTPRTAVKRSICHLDSNDFSIFPFSGINLTRAQSLTWLFFKQTKNEYWIRPWILNIDFMPVQCRGATKQNVCKIVKSICNKCRWKNRKQPTKKQTNNSLRKLEHLVFCLFAELFSAGRPVS